MGVFKLGKLTLTSLFKKPVTVAYPYQPVEYPAATRGHIELDASTCILCGICAKACPADALEVDRKVTSTWRIKPLSCVQCGYCVSVCPHDCLTMEVNYSPATTVKGEVVVEVTPPKPKPKPKPAPVSE